MRQWRVGIVGGGPGGLLTAYFLEKLASEPFSTSIFEASSRFGGKVLTNRFSLAEDHGESSRVTPFTQFDQFLSAIPEPDVRRYIEALIHSDLATEPERTSAAYGLHNYLMNHPAYMQLYCIEGGNERLTREL